MNATIKDDYITLLLLAIKQDGDIFDRIAAEGPDDHPSKPILYERAKKLREIYAEVKKDLAPKENFEPKLGTSLTAALNARPDRDRMLSMIKQCRNAITHSEPDKGGIYKPWIGVAFIAQLDKLISEIE